MTSSYNYDYKSDVYPKISILPENLFNMNYEINKININKKNIKHQFIIYCYVKFENGDGTDDNTSFIDVDAFKKPIMYDCNPYDSYNHSLPIRTDQNGRHYMYEYIVLIYDDNTINIARYGYHRSFRCCIRDYSCDNFKEYSNIIKYSYDIHILESECNKYGRGSYLYCVRIQKKNDVIDYTINDLYEFGIFKSYPYMLNTIIQAMDNDGIKQSEPNKRPHTDEPCDSDEHTNKRVRFTDQ